MQTKFGGRGARFKSECGMRIAHKTLGEEWSYTQSALRLPHSGYIPATTLGTTRNSGFPGSLW
jgi:hypothetical protein